MKIGTLDDLEAFCRARQALGQRVVHCHGVFDLLHPGHVQHLEAARALGDILVVTLTPDRFVDKGPGRPAFTERLRAQTVAGLESVTWVAITSAPSAVEAIRQIRPAVYVKGSDYATAADDPQLAAERQAVAEVGGRVHFTDATAFSSSRLINAHFDDVYPETAQAFLRDFRQRYTVDQVLAQLARLQALKVLIIGEAIIDEYHYVQALQKSPKELLIPTRSLRTEQFAGGALACANHVAGFATSVDLLTTIGAWDPHEPFIRRQLKPNVTPLFFPVEAPTIVKRRYIEQAFLAKMFEVVFLDEGEIAPPVSRRIAGYLAQALPRYDLVLVADYGHGLLTRELIQVLAEQARCLAVNVQANSANLGYNLITKYPRADYVCIDEPEVRLAAHDRASALDAIVGPLRKDLASRMVTITRGHLGSVTYADDQAVAVPALSRDVVDRVGAGDAYLSVTALCVAAGFPPELVGFIGNAVGALAVRTVGNRMPIGPDTLYPYLVALLK